MIALLAAVLTLAAPAPRFAVVAASNEGAPGRPRLWFAEKDAGRFRAALQEIGAFPPEQVASVRGPGARAFRDAFARVEVGLAAARARGERPLLVVYYSGHAGPGGLELGPETLTYDELKALVASSAAEAKVVIVDACEAGALTQVKGAHVAPAVDFPLPTADSVQGTAFLASTAVGEAAQESAALGGSFFTHHLEVAMRGAGDADLDGLVTLAEAFRYTAARTVLATAATSHGPQHPTYDFRMAGRGDVVLSDLRRAEAHLLIPQDPGALYVLHGPRGLVAEVSAGPAQLRLAVPAGRYEIERRGANGRARGDLGVARGEERLVPVLQPTRYEVARTKGGPRQLEAFAGVGAHLVSMPGGGVAPAVRGGVRREVGPAGLLVTLEYALADVTDGAFKYEYSRLGGDAALVLPVAGGRRLVEAGAFAGWGWATQTLRDRRTYHAGDATAGFLVRTSVPIRPASRRGQSHRGRPRLRAERRARGAPGRLPLLRRPLRVLNVRAPPALGSAIAALLAGLALGACGSGLYDASGVPAAEGGAGSPALPGRSSAAASARPKTRTTAERRARPATSPCRPAAGPRACETAPSRPAGTSAPTVASGAPRAAAARPRSPRATGTRAPSWRAARSRAGARTRAGRSATGPPRRATRRARYRSVRRRSPWARELAHVRGAPVRRRPLLGRGRRRAGDRDGHGPAGARPWRLRSRPARWPSPPVNGGRSTKRIGIAP